MISDSQARPSRLQPEGAIDETSLVLDIPSNGEDLGDDPLEGMDPQGFSGPSEKVVKPLTKEALAAFKAAHEKAGVIYISRIPPGMQPAKVRFLMSAYGEVGRVYLQQEGEMPRLSLCNC
jgi:ESF2/ABP1 family protein